MTNGQAVMHYSRRRLTASVTYASTNGFVPLAHWSVRQKLNRASSVQFRYVVCTCCTQRRTSLRDWTRHGMRRNTRLNNTTNVELAV